MSEERSEPEQVIPFEKLPDGFAESVESIPPEPAPARAAATVVLMRDPDPNEATDAEPSIEVLLLRRNRRTGFVPGAYVFPGGRVDSEDATTPLIKRFAGRSIEACADRLSLGADADPPAVAYYIAAIREAFEETGLLVANRADGGPPPPVEPGSDAADVWAILLENDERFPQALDALECIMDGGAVEYVAHWITPLVEPRRYDTRFFAAAVDRHLPVMLNRNELTDAIWLPPTAALERQCEGTLPMVFPTIKTLESLVGFRSTEEALRTFAEREIPSILPRLVKTPTGVGLEIEES